MNAIKERIIKVLSKKNKTYEDLCNELKISEKDLDMYILSEDIRIFEKISKAIRVPLYNFYHKKFDKGNNDTKRYYDQDLWED